MKAKYSLLFLSVVLSASADDYTNPDGGNTNVNIGDTKIPYGYAPPWYAFDEIKTGCPSNGCNSENKIEYATGVIQDGEMIGANIVMSVEGSFNDAGQPGNIDDLVEIVKAAAGASPYDYTQGATYYTGNGCVVSSFIPCDPGNKEYADQYSATNLIVVRVEDANGAELADMSVSVSIEFDDAGSGVCADLTTVGSVLAGAVSGLAGGIFTLAGLACA